MTRIRAAFNSALIFAGVCLMLGGLGALLIDTSTWMVIYACAVLLFATWLSRETYVACRAVTATRRSA